MSPVRRGPSSQKGTKHNYPKTRKASSRENQHGSKEAPMVFQGKFQRVRLPLTPAEIFSQRGAAHDEN